MFLQLRYEELEQPHGLRAHLRRVQQLADDLLDIELQFQVGVHLAHVAVPAGGPIITGCL